MDEVDSKKNSCKVREPDNRPVIGNVMLAGAGVIQRNLYIRLDGLDILTYNNNMFSTNIPYSVGVSLNYGVNIQIRDCEIHEIANLKYPVSRGKDLGHCDQVPSYHHHIRRVGGGVDANYSRNGTLNRNYFHHLGGGTGIAQRVLTSNCIIAFNPIFDSGYPAWCGNILCLFPEACMEGMKSAGE